MIVVYARSVQNGLIKFSLVPTKYREAVKAQLIEWGLEELAQ